MTKLQCDMEKDCTNPVTHIGEKWLYCKTHGIQRRQSGYERTRQMRQWEIRTLESGGQISVYASTRRK